MPTKSTRNVFHRFWGRLIGTALLALATLPALVHAADASSLTLETKIPLGDVSGRIDHLAFDPTRERLYVAELGNDSIGIVDMKTRRVIRTVAGFDEPQGVGYEPATDTIYVANGRDGSVRIFSGADFALLETIPLRKDSDNVRIDRAAKRVYVGYGNGALAVIDPIARKQIANIPLQGHPESFQLDPASERIFVDVPDAGHIAVVSRQTQQPMATWPTEDLHANYPLAIDGERNRVITAFRRPARLQSYDINTGRALSRAAICSDSDDVFVDSKRQRVYVICGQGYVDTLDSSSNTFTHVGRLTTSDGSRTGLLLPDLDRLFVAICATHGEPAAIWVIRPSP